MSHSWLIEFYTPDLLFLSSIDQSLDFIVFKFTQKLNLFSNTLSSSISSNSQLFNSLLPEITHPKELVNLPELKTNFWETFPITHFYNFLCIFSHPLLSEHVPSFSLFMFRHPNQRQLFFRASPIKIQTIVVVLCADNQPLWLTLGQSKKISVWELRVPRGFLEGFFVFACELVQFVNL